MSLWNEIQTKCSAEMLARRNMHEIAAFLNINRTKTVQTMMGERGILSKYATGPVDADAVLSKLEAFSQSQHPMASLVKRAVRFLGTTEGIDLGDPATQMLLDQLAAVAAITVTEAENLKALASVPDTLDWTQVQAAFDAQGA